MPKLQITLTTREADLLSKKANELGYGLVKYVKFLLGQEAEKAAKEGGNTPVKATPAPKKAPKPTKADEKAANDALNKLKKEAKAMQDMNQNPAADQGTGMPTGNTPTGVPPSAPTPEPPTPVTPMDTPTPTPPAPTGGGSATEAPAPTGGGVPPTDTGTPAPAA